MGLFKRQFANVVEWQEFRDDMIFYKWSENELKKGSRLIIRPGQDAIFLANGKIDGIFTDEGDYDIESEIIPFLSVLKGLKFGFKTGMRAEVLFVNTKEFQIKWGTKNAVLVPAPNLPGGLPIRANGTLTFKVVDYVGLIDQVAGVKNQYYVEDVKLRITAVLDQLLMKHIAGKGKDMFNLQANASEISSGIQDDLNMELMKLGLKVTNFNVMSFNYPQEIQDMITKNASHSMIGNMGTYQQVSMTDGMASGNIKGGGAAADMAGMMMGINIAKDMMKTMEDAGSSAGSPADGKKPNFCPNCGAKTEGANFCPNCGQKL
ncbi:SPFH domain-containing protein [Anaerolentibacter hominis]|uniref:SPFH domain-containing protein n=1 Tax=Anaerolentibacter hominis TaxID=3079009 RepID=UPI0031B7F543